MNRNKLHDDWKWVAYLEMKMGKEILKKKLEKALGAWKSSGKAWESLDSLGLMMEE